MPIAPVRDLIAGATRDSFIREGVHEANEWQRRSQTRDSYQNFAARLGLGTANVSSFSTYGFDPITRIRTLLEWMYRGSWIVGKAVDSIAEDMTKTGVSWLGSQTPEDQDKLNQGIRKTMLWKRLQQGHKWGRLYGGALVVMMIDGQKLDSPLKVDRISKGQLKGYVVLDRWMVNPSFTQLVSDPASPDQGFPEFYDVVTYAPPALIGQRVHHTRCFRMIGVELPYWQMVWENYWGMSVLERLYDRLVAFDSSTQGAAQLMYRAYLRTLKVKDLRKIVAAGGKAYDGLVKQIETMRLFQSNEGISTIDAEDEFTTSSYSFAGVGETILQMGQQLSGAIDTPLVRLFGQSPTGMNSTGESDMRIYEDGVLQRQENDMRPQLEVAIRVTALSEGVKLSDDFGFKFNPLSKMTVAQRSEVAQRNTQTVLAVQESGVVSEQVILRELKQQSEETGIWTNITDEDIDAADDEPAPDVPQPGEIGPEGEDVGANEPRETGRLPRPRVGEGESRASDGVPVRFEQRGGSVLIRKVSDNQMIHWANSMDAARGYCQRTGLAVRDDQDDHAPPALAASADPPIVEVCGISCVIETRRGERRAGPGWSVIMPADYGYVRGTGSAEGLEDTTDGLREQMDIFVGPDRSSDQFWVIDAADPMTGAFDEHKIMAGFSDQGEALAHFRAAYQDSARGRLMGHTRMDRDQLLKWLANGDHRYAVSVPREAL